MNPPADRKADDDEDDDFVDVPGLPPAESGSTAAAVSAAVSASASARPRAAAGGPQPARKQEDGDVTYVSVAGRKLATDRLRVGGAMFTRRHENEVMSDTRVQRQNGSADKSSKDKRTSSEVDEAARARRREELLARAPVVPYTPELETWGREEEIASVPVAGVLDVNCNWQTGSVRGKEIGEGGKGKCAD